MMELVSEANMTAAEWERYRGCTRKEQLPDERTAKKVANILQRKYGVPFNYYGCVYCGSWHVGRKHTQGARLHECTDDDTDNYAD